MLRSLESRINNQIGNQESSQRPNAFQLESIADRELPNTDQSILID